MKKLIIVFSLFFALGVSAQDRKTATANTASSVKANPSKEEIAKSNLANLVSFVPIDGEKQHMLFDLFVTKNKMLNAEGTPSAEKKAEVARIIERKLEATLDGPTFAKVKANTELFNSLVN